MSGFSDGDLSMLAGENAVEEKLGHRIRRVSEVEDDPDVPRAEHVAPESDRNAQGELIGGLTYVGATAAAGAIALAGGLIAPPSSAGCATSAPTTWGILVLWVRTANPDRQRRADEIMERNAVWTDGARDGRLAGRVGCSRTTVKP